MDSGTAALFVAGITGGLSLASKTLDWVKDRRKEQSADEHQANDSAYQRAEYQASDYFKQLKGLERAQAELRAKYQEALEDNDKLMGENRKMRRTIEELRSGLNKRNKP